ncbi:Oidioi.mRNA.OKI2018_I69.PAR.g9295.t1.cds [Oikopleura dioica]|uniref:Oidioi.mRNA.OKI2018_I69.PAR.g9295.t1.cds n=1 Tax=Oikopleura dioica TaxID=34765 RepID=A0ABN7RMP2_OIKDI|nr:Oidioi.mRNA.OKI2018_I69.PAR.g9295.t1.cds [Oikopleura dioica]
MARFFVSALFLLSGIAQAMPSLDGMLDFTFHPSLEAKLENEFARRRRTMDAHYEGDEHSWHNAADFDDLQKFFENAKLSF